MFACAIVKCEFFWPSFYDLVPLKLATTCAHTSLRVCLCSCVGIFIFGGLPNFHIRLTNFSVTEYLVHSNEREEKKKHFKNANETYLLWCLYVWHKRMHIVQRTCTHKLFRSIISKQTISNFCLRWTLLISLSAICNIFLGGCTIWIASLNAIVNAKYSLH